MVVIRYGHTARVGADLDDAWANAANVGVQLENRASCTPSQLEGLSLLLQTFDSSI